MEKNIACCFLTHNHPEVMKEVLGIVTKYYGQNGIDIYVYDSSIDDETKKIVNHIISQGNDNLFYIKIDEKLGGDGKMLCILKQYGLKKHYQYIWPNKDRSYVLKESIDKISKACRMGYAGILIGIWTSLDSYRNKFLKEYEREEIFYKFGWTVNSWENVIFSTEMLSSISNWEEFEKKYKLGSANNFNQPMVFFGALALMQKPIVRVMDYNEIKIKNCSLESSSWIPYTFEVWGKNWPEAIERLPRCYDAYKNKVIKDQGMNKFVFGSINNLISLKENGIFTKEKWNMVKEKWNILTDISSRCAEYVLQGKYDLAIKDIYICLERKFNVKDYDGAYSIFENNSYLQVFLPYKQYWILKTSFYIYVNEIYRKIENGIMHNVRSCGDLICKYEKLKYFIRRIEYNIPLDINFTDFCEKEKISNVFITVMILNETLQQDKVIDSVNRLFAEGKD